MSADLNYDFSANERMQRHMQALASLDLSELAGLVSTEGESQTRRRISSEKTAPDGSAWPELVSWYKDIKGGSGGLLEGEGNLLDSIQENPEGDVASWGSNLVYAAIHNFGGTIKPKNGKALAIGSDSDVMFAKSVDIPQREYLGLSADNLDDIEYIVIDWIERKTGALS